MLKYPVLIFQGTSFNDGWLQKQNPVCERGVGPLCTCLDKVAPQRQTCFLAFPVSVHSEILLYLHALDFQRMSCVYLHVISATLGGCPCTVPQCLSALWVFLFPTWVTRTFLLYLLSNISCSPCNAMTSAKTSLPFSAPLFLTQCRLYGAVFKHALLI